MPDKLKEIISKIKRNPNDEENFGRRYVDHFIGNNEIFWDETNNFEYLRQFIKDTIEFQKVDIEYHKKHSPQVYHQNTYRSREFENEVLEQILKMLEN